MVTSNKQSDKKVVKMAEPNNSDVVPQRTLLGEVNEHITCPLCRGYYIDATTIVECLHSFCRSCIIKHLQVKSYCPVCEMMINSAKPNIKLDKALQDIVYKLVPGLFQKEMERRQQFYSSRPGPAASATPEQRGEDTERIIFSPEDVISFSLEYSDITDSDSISSKSSDSNEPQPTAATRRYLQCPAVVNINHLKKFLSMKFDIDSTQFAIDILYKRVPLPDYYTLMDIAYIYNWKRNEPMRFFYQIIDYVAIRNRLFDIKRKGPQFPDRKSSPTGTEDTNASSPAPNMNDQGSEVSSGTDSPMPEENSSKKTSDMSKPNETLQLKNKEGTVSNLVKKCPSPSKKNDDEVEKSQFLNSFELTAKNNSTNTKSPTKTSPGELNTKENVLKTSSIKSDESLKRKLDTTKNFPEFKKVKIELEKTKIPIHQLEKTNIPINQTVNVSSSKNTNFTGSVQKLLSTDKEKPVSLPTSNVSNSPALKDNKQPQASNLKQHTPDNSGQKRPVSSIHTVLSPKRKPDSQLSVPSPHTQKTVSPLKLQIPKPDPPISKPPENPKPVMKKMPDLKPSIPLPPSTQNKSQPVKLRMDLLANNCDPTIDRSKILSQVKTSLPVPTTTPPSGDPLKSLFDSCKINIPSSLSITLTDQKLDPRSPPDQSNLDLKKNLVNKNLTSASNTSGHKVPSPPVHNYIEILKLPDVDPKKPCKMETTDKTNTANKSETNPANPKPPKTSETSAKGPVPNLKPIADTKLGKHINSSPITFQQTFEQQLLKSEKKTKVSKNKMQVPKLVPATPKAIAANKLSNSNGNKLGNVCTPTTESKSSTALDLSTPHNIQSQLGPQQTKAFETMQSIANLAKKQNIPSKPLPSVTPVNNSFSNLSNRPLNSANTPLRHPSTSTLGHIKLDKNVSNVPNSPRQESLQKGNQGKQSTSVSGSIPSPNYQVTSHSSPNAPQPSPHSQTRSPSTSPKLVIAEEKQANSSSTSEPNINQSNQITSTQIPNVIPSKTDAPKVSPGPSKSVLKPVRPLMPNKLTGIRQPITPTLAPNSPINSPTDYRPQSPLITHAQHAILRHQMEIQNAWFKAQRHFDLFKNMSNMNHQSQNDFSNKEKQ